VKPHTHTYALFDLACFGVADFVILQSAWTTIQRSKEATKHSNFQDCRYFVNPKTANFRAIDAPVWNTFCI